MTTDSLATESILNLADAMTNMDGDAELLQEIVEIFMETADTQLQTLDTSIAAGESAQVAMLAHAMKGGASNFCAGRFVAAALQLELLAKEGSLDGAADVVGTMRECLDEVAEVVRTVNWDEVGRNWRG